MKKKVEKRFSITSIIILQFSPHSCPLFRASTHSAALSAYSILIHAYSNRFQPSIVSYLSLQMLRSVVVEKRKKSVDKNLPSKKFTPKHRPYSLKTLVPHRKYLAMIVQCHFGEQQHTTEEIQSFYSDEKKREKHFSKFSSFPSFQPVCKLCQRRETLYKTLTSLVHSPRADINAKQPFPCSFGKRKKSLFIN